MLMHFREETDGGFGRGIYRRRVEGTGSGSRGGGGHGPDGWPLLALAMGGEALGAIELLAAFEPQAEPIVHLLEASTGREQHRVLGLEEPWNDRPGWRWAS